MSHRRIPKRKAILAGAGAVGIAAAAVLLPHANASQSGSGSDASGAVPKKMSAASAAELIAQLGKQLGDSAYGGAYYDAEKQQIVVNVVGDDNDIDIQVKKAGAVARSVENSFGELKSATGTLAKKATIPGTSWAVDPRTNQILVTADRTVTGDQWNRLESTVKSLGGMARVQKSKGEFKPFLEGGDAIFGGGSRCSLGFNVTAQDGSPAFLTAGHCGVAAAEWSEAQGGAPVGTVQEAVFPGEGDFALVKYDDPNIDAPSEVDLGNGQTVQINQAADAAVGQDVIRMGSTTGQSDGQVTGLNATVNYPEGTVTGLIQTNVCAEPGDSGGAMFSQDGSAIGLTSGGSGDCTSGGETFFQPVTTALAAVGAQIGAGDGGAGDGGAGDDAGNAGAGNAGAGDDAGNAGAGNAGAGDDAGNAGAGNAGAGDEAGNAGAGDDAGNAGAGGDLGNGGDAGNGGDLGNGGAGGDAGNGDLGNGGAGDAGDAGAEDDGLGQQHG
ncbi:S1 family peptidase [Streptomyces sp. NPDC051907]|uniref:S1 family peptidase n=1 Tax=Streptomyces sp. NPDC051907 TaxID=3155284 RepID=UPI0034164E07